MMSRKGFFAAVMVLGFGTNAVADTLAELEAEDIVFPVAWEDIVLVQPSSDEIRLPDADLRHDAMPCFGFLSRLEFVQNSNDLAVVGWCEEGGWTGPARATVYKYSPDGALIGETSVQDAGEPAMGHGDGWDIHTFSDGGVVACGTARFGLPAPLDVIDWGLPGVRRFESDLTPLSPLESPVEPELVPGNDERDFTGAGENLLRPRIAVLPGEGNDERYVLSYSLQSAELQKSVGLTDPGGEAAPGAKIYYRVFQKDGTPVTATQLGFDIDADDDLGRWGASYARHDIETTGDGGFMMVTLGPAPAVDGDATPIYFFDRDGNRSRDPFSVHDPDLVANAVVPQNIIEPELFFGNGVYALQSAVILEGTQNMALTMFDIAPDDSINIVRSTFNASSQKNLSPIRESEMGMDPRGNIFVTTRGEYTDPDTGFPLGPDDQNDMLTVRIFDNTGEPFTAPFIPYSQDAIDPNTGEEVNNYIGSQRDPQIDANSGFFAVIYLSDAPPSTVGGLNAFRIFENPVAGFAVPYDVNLDGGVDISDPVADLNFQFAGVALASCLLDDAGLLKPSTVELVDFNGDGGHDISDPVASLNWQFAGGGFAPHPRGVDCVDFNITCDDACSQ